MARKNSGNPFLDEAGAQVVHFAADVRTLGKLGELRGKIIEMGESGAWRRYRTAAGTDEWLECEFDYFLISCDLEYDDVYRAIAHANVGAAVRGMMDPAADPDKRRTLEEAAAGWHAPVPETLVERAVRLRWTKDAKGTLRVPPLSDRQRLQQQGTTREEHARKERAKRIPAKRRRELDSLARETRKSLTDEHEVRYLLDQIAKLAARRAGRPTGDHEQWAKDVAELDGDTKALAERWGITQRAAQMRAKEIRVLSSQVRS